MKEYPHTSRAFKVNGKKFVMKKFTLGLQSRIEDPDVDVTIVEVLEACTDMGHEDIMGLDGDQLEAIYVDVRDFSYSSKESGDGEPKKPLS